MTSKQSPAAANQVAQGELRITTQKTEIALSKTRAFVGAAISQNVLET
jgi:hypothetical protein